MPVYQPDHIEYATVSGRIQIALEDGRQIPAFWSHPNVGKAFPGVVLMHDWWGITGVERRLAAMFAQVGYYVIVPDLYNGRIAETPQEAMSLVEEVMDGSGFRVMNTALQVLETHHRCTHRVAAFGLGLGGSMAYEAAIVRHDLEAAVSIYGFPQRYFGRFSAAHAPILAIYGSDEPHVTEEVRARLRRELFASPLSHELVILDGVGRDFFAEDAPAVVQAHGKIAWSKTLTFIEQHLESPHATRS